MLVKWNWLLHLGGHSHHLNHKDHDQGFPKAKQGLAIKYIEEQQLGTKTTDASHSRGFLCLFLFRNSSVHLLVTPLASPHFPDPTFHPTVIFSFLCCSAPSNHTLLKVPVGLWKMLVHLANLPRSRAYALDFQGFLQVPQGPELLPLEAQFLCLACRMGQSPACGCAQGSQQTLLPVRVIPAAPHPFQDHPCLLIGSSLGELLIFLPPLASSPCEAQTCLALLYSPTSFPTQQPSSHLLGTVVNNLQGSNSNSFSLPLPSSPSLFPSLHPSPSFHPPFSPE